VIIVVLYWMLTWSPLATWHAAIESALHAAVTAVTVQIVTEVTFIGRRFGARSWASTASIGRGTGRQLRRAAKWLASRVHITVGVKLHLGAA